MCIRDRLNIARFTAADPCAGLPDVALLATRAEGFADLDLYHPWLLSVEGAIGLARRCEQAAFAVSPQVTNSEGASVSIQEGQFISANSLGFMGGYPTLRHYLSCSVIAGKDENMQRDDWYSTSRDAQHIATPESIGDYAARRALSRLGARKIKTCKVPVLFEAPLAASLIGNFIHSVSGGALYLSLIHICCTGSVTASLYLPATWRVWARSERPRVGSSRMSVWVVSGPASMR